MRLSRWIVGIVVVGLLAGAGWLVRARLRGAASASSSAGGGGRGGAAGADGRPVPVVVTAVLRRDVPVYLEGLGSVSAFYTVTVHSQVDGRLDTVAFREGQDVHRGDLLAQIDPRPFSIQLHNAEGVLARDRAQLIGAQATLQRDQQLRADHYVAPQDIDTAQAAVGQFEGSVRSDQTQIASARLSLEYARITSPIDGVAGVRLVDPGNIVHASDPTGLVMITQLDPIAVFFTLPEDDLPQIAAAMHEGNVPVDVYTRDGDTLLASGHLTVIDNQINQTTATIRLKAVFDNPQRVLWPNQFVKARVLVATRRRALVVPSVAIQRGPQGTFVYTVGSDQRVSVAVVVIASQEGDMTLVSSGVTEGEMVVTDGQSRLRAGARVSFRPADGAAPAAGGAGAAGHGGHGAHGGHAPAGDGGVGHGPQGSGGSAGRAGGGT